MMKNILEVDFRKKMEELELLISSGFYHDYQMVFGDVQDDLYTFMCLKTFSGYPNIRSLIPDWTPDDVRQQSTGAFSIFDHIQDASLFWRIVREFYRKTTGRNLAESRVLDYGAGQGRVTRIAAKDVSQANLFMSEPNPIFQEELVRCRLPGSLIRTDWESLRPLNIDPVDLIFSYSIFTHTSDELARNIVERWIEITNPGSVVAFTVRPGSFLDGDGPEMGIFTPKERERHAFDYAHGDIIYKPYASESPHWGVTVMPMPYIVKIFGEKFILVDTLFQMQTWNQVIVVMQRV